MAEDKQYREDIYSSAVRAGKRTYFFDVRATRGNDLYLTITESKRRYQDDGRFSYEKHKLFLYKEDFEKFTEGLNHAVDKIRELQETGQYSSEEHQAPYDAHDSPQEDKPSNSEEKAYTDVSFEDLED